MLRSIWEFAYSGEGTLAPFDEPKRLVIKGLYRYFRNPMYAGLVGILVGETLFFTSLSMMGYTILVFVTVNLFIIGFEEPRLLAKYGSQYEEYCKKVPRWIPKKV